MAEKYFMPAKSLFRDSLPYWFLVVASLVHWKIVEGGTAFEGPGLDMVLFFRRLADPSFLPGDFLTNANQIANPRMVFGYLVAGLQALFSVDWYSVYFFFKICFVILLPYSWVRLLEACLAYIQPELAGRRVARWLFVLFVIVAVWDRIPGLDTRGILSIKSIFAIAWWPPIYTSTSPQTLATCLGLFAAARSLDQRRLPGGMNPLLIVATLFHPTVSIVGYIFVIVVVASSSNPAASIVRLKGILVEILIGWLLPCLLLTLVFRSSEQLSGDVFAFIYAIQAHPSHYWMQGFGSFSRYTWKFAFFSVGMILSVSAILAWVLKLHRVAWLAALSLLVYLSLPAIQYLAVDVLRNKLLVAFAPVRLSMLGYWFCIFVITLLMTELFGRRVQVNKDLVLSKEPRLVSLCIAAMATALGLLGSAIVKDDPSIAARDRYPMLRDWIGRNTQANAIFAVPFGALTSLMPLSYSRGVFAGAGFPFVEDGMVEFCVRDQLLYGTPEERANKKGSWVGDSMAQIYQSRTPGQFAYMSQIFPLNYIVVEENHAKAFRAVAVPNFSGDGFEVYSLLTLLSKGSIVRDPLKISPQCQRQ